MHLYQGEPEAEGCRCDRRSVRPVHPDHIRSDNGPELIAKALREWIATVGAKTTYIMPRSPREEWLLRELQLEASR